MMEKMRYFSGGYNFVGSEQNKQNTYINISGYRGYKTLNIPLVLNQEIPKLLEKESEKFV